MGFYLLGLDHAAAVAIGFQSERDAFDKNDQAECFRQTQGWTPQTRTAFALH